MFRDMRRSKQQITPEECVRILETAKRGVLAVHGENGYPYAIPMDFVYEDGKIYFHSAKEGHKIDAVRANAKVSFCVLNDGVQEENDWWFHFISVVAFGQISEITQEDEKDRALRLFGRRYFPSEQVLEKEMKSAPNAAVLMLTIEHMTGKRVREK